MNSTTKQMMDDASQATGRALKQTRRYAEDAFDDLGDMAQDAKGRLNWDRMSSQAGDMARKGMDYARDGAMQLRDRAARASDSTLGYIREEPIKALLIAAVAGGALMAIYSLMSRRSGDDY